jgi:beta-fructofuranosidase
MFAIDDEWVWDFWPVDDGVRYHLFFLHAPKSLGDPNARHFNASIGHAVSDDLVTWERRPDALAKGEPGAFDGLATWTGSVVRGDDGLWYLFYTGASLTEAGNVQTVGCATSADLETFTKVPGPLLRAEAPWYERLSEGAWHDEAFRDPWVFRDPDGAGWHMLITARTPSGPRFERGVVGHATSPDLRVWTLQPPLSEQGQGFGQLEVMEPVRLGGRDFLLFNCLAGDRPEERRTEGSGGTWLAPASGPLGPYDLAGAQLLTDDRFYVTRPIVERGTGRTLLMAFRNAGDDGAFVGELTDPVELALVDGRPRIVGPGAEAWQVRATRP